MEERDNTKITITTDQLPWLMSDFDQLRVGGDIVAKSLDNRNWGLGKESKILCRLEAYDELRSFACFTFDFH